MTVHPFPPQPDRPPCPCDLSREVERQRAQLADLRADLAAGRRFMARLRERAPQMVTRIAGELAAEDRARHTVYRPR